MDSIGSFSPKKDTYGRSEALRPEISNAALQSLARSTCETVSLRSEVPQQRFKVDLSHIESLISPAATNRKKLLEESKIAYDSLEPVSERAETTAKSDFSKPVLEDDILLKESPVKDSPAKMLE